MERCRKRKEPLGVSGLFLKVLLRAKASGCVMAFKKKFGKFLLGWNVAE